VIIVLGMHLSQNKMVLSLVNVCCLNCGLNMQYVNAPNIILGIMDPLDPDSTKKQVILIKKYN
jgi:hypothetical protein